MTAIPIDATTEVIAPDDSADDSASSNVRGWACFLAIGGGLTMLTPAWAVGVIMLIVGLSIAGTTKIVEPVETKAINQTKQDGHGCVWMLLTVAMITFFGVFILAILGAIVESGVLTP